MLAKAASKADTRRPARGDDFGSTARTGRGAVRMPGNAERSDGLISTRRLQELAHAANTTGFTLSVMHGFETRSGFAVPARPDRCSTIGTKFICGEEWSGVTADDVMQYIRENVDLLSRPGHLLVASRDRRTGNVTLDVCMVVSTLPLAKSMCRTNGCEWVVRVQDGTRQKV